MLEKGCFYKTQWNFIIAVGILHQGAGLIEAIRNEDIAKYHDIKAHIAVSALRVAFQLVYSLRDSCVRRSQSFLQLLELSRGQ